MSHPSYTSIPVFPDRSLEAVKGRRSASDAAVHSNLLQGYVPDPEFEALREQYIQGEFTSEEFRKKIIERHGLK